MKIGQVTLVGAGPGDPGLLTIAGKKAILEAEVIVYDRLVSPEILALMPEKAEKINVGKQAANHPVPQDRINEILLEKALEGKNVVRLKGGDPFLFGRGGEELELLAENRIPFREIPGITSAIAAPAYGGIPVTHRDFCSSVHIITGHQRAGKPLTIPFRALAETGGTLVFLMGVSSLEAICRGLLENGMEPQMPAATVERGTRPDQRVTLGTLQTLPELARQQKVESPAVIVVGKVCSLSPDFNWFSALPLAGKHLIVTRPKERAGTLSSRLRALGALVTEFPCIETLPIEPCPAMAEALSHIEDYAYLVFTSPAGVDTLFRQLEKDSRDARALAHVLLAAIGPGTDRELRKHGLRADLIPPVYDGAHLGEALCSARPAGKVLILRAQWGTPALTDALDAGHIPYEDIRVYETRYACPHAQQVKAMLDSRPLITFTSASTVKGFAASMEGTDFSRLTGVCIGKQTQSEAEKYGFHTITAREATMDGLIDCIIKGE